MPTEVIATHTGHHIPLNISQVRGFLGTVLESLGYRNVKTPRDFKVVKADWEDIKRGVSTWSFLFKVEIIYRKQDDNSTVLDYKVSESKVKIKKNCQDKLTELVDAITRFSAEFVESRAEEEQNPPETFGSARFANEAELLQKGYLTRDLPADRLLIAPYEGDRYVTVPPALTKMHGLICGPTGSGKSSGFFIPNIVSRTDCSAIITEATAGDETPELFAKTAGWRAFKGNKVYFFNPAYAKGTRINPLDKLKRVSPSDFAQVAEGLAHLVIVNTSPPTAQRADPIWDKAEKYLLWIMIMHVATVGEPEIAHLGAIRELVRKSEKQIRSVLKNSPSVVAREEFDSFLHHSSENFRHGVFAGLLQRLNPWLSDVIQTLTQTTDLDLDQLKTERFAFYFSVPSRKEHLKPIAALVFNFLMDLALEQAFDYPPALILDEFTNFGAIPKIDDALSLIRKRDLPVVLGIQTYEQIEKVYGRLEAKQLISQLATRVFFRPRTATQAEQISEELGEMTVVDRKTDDRGNTMVREIGKSLMTARDLQTLPPGQVIVMTDSTNPLKVSRFDYLNFPAPDGFEVPDLPDHKLLKVERLDDNKLTAAATSAKHLAEKDIDFAVIKTGLDEIFSRSRVPDEDVRTEPEPAKPKPQAKLKPKPQLADVPIEERPVKSKKNAKKVTLPTDWDIPG